MKEDELETDATIETSFYLQAAYDSAVAASNSEGRQAGRADVTGNPANFDLTTVGAYNTVVAERDARPTQAVYEAVITERNARFVDTDGDGLTDVKEDELETDATIETSFYLQAAYDSAVAASNSEGSTFRRHTIVRWLHQIQKAARPGEQTLQEILLTLILQQWTPIIL